MTPGTLAPGETVTMLFTDIEGSTRHLQALGDGPWAELLAQHDDLIRTAIEQHSGRTVKTEGDSFFVVFAHPDQAVAAALSAQRRLLERTWPTSTPLRVRMGLHLGQARAVGTDYIGLAVHEAARLSAVGHGGQVVVSEAVRRGCSALPDEASLTSLGEHVVRDFPTPQALYQLAHPSLPAHFPPLRTTTAVTHVVPVPPTAIVGRSTELEHCREVLLSGGRLVTLTGPGGVGKTRLAIELAQAALPHFPGGVWFVGLEGLRTGSPVLPEVSRVLGFKQDAEDDPVTTLATALAGRGRCLVVLDTMEHVLPDAPSVARLLSAQPDLSILATSRERLHLRGEHLLELAPLQPAAAVELFKARAADSWAGALADADEPVVERICGRLERMPLAIELAVGRLGLGLETLDNSLRSGFELVAGGGQDLAPRQRAIAATVAWSADLLSPAERAALAAFSVFSGGASPVAATEVAGSATEIAGLLDKSLLSRREGRLWMLESVRRFAAAELVAAVQGEAAARRHTAWFVEFVDGAADGLTGPDQAELLAALDREHDNNEAVLDRLNAAGDPAHQRMAAKLGRYWEVRGHWSRGLAHLETAVSLGPRSEWYGGCLLWAGRLALRCGRSEAARAYLEAGRQFLLDAGDLVAAGRCLDALGEVARSENDLERAGRAYTEAQELFARVGSGVDAAVTRQNQGALAMQRGEAEEAERCFVDALGPLRRARDERRAARVSMNLGMVLVEQQRFARAAEHIESSLVAFNQIGDREGVSAALSNLGHLLATSGRRGEARAPFLEALVLARELGDQAAIGRNVVNLEQIGCGTEELLREGLLANRAAGATAGAALCAYRLGMMALAEGRSTEAREWLTETSELYGDLGMTMQQAWVLLTLAEIAEDLAMPSVAADNRSRAEQVIRSTPAPAIAVEQLLEEARAGHHAATEAWLAALELAGPDR